MSKKSRGNLTDLAARPPFLPRKFSRLLRIVHIHRRVRNICKLTLSQYREIFNPPLKIQKQLITHQLT